MDRDKDVFEKDRIADSGQGSEDYLLQWKNDEDEVVEGLSIGACLIGVFTSPGATFRSLRKKTHILIPLLIIVVTSILSSFLSMGAMENYTRLAMEAAMAKQAQTLPPEMIDAQLKVAMRFMLFVAPLTAFATPLIKGMITHGMSRLFDGKGKMKATISVIALSYMIIMAGSLLRVPMMMATNNIVTFSPAMLLGADQMGSPWSSFLMNFDIFTLWYLGVSAVGIKEVHRISFGKALTSVLAPFGIILLLSLSSVILQGLSG